MFYLRVDDSRPDIIFENVDLHNLAEVHSVAGGMRFQRVPEEVRQQINESAQMRVLQPDNCEIRFVTNGSESKVTLSSEGETDVTVFYGTYDGRDRYIIGREPTTISLVPQERLLNLDRKWWAGQPFSPHLRHLSLRTRLRRLYSGADRLGHRIPRAVSEHAGVSHG